MPLLEHPRLLELAKAAIEAMIATQRDALLVGIHPRVLGMLPGSQPPLPQVMSDLNRFSELGRLTDATIPLVTWLDNAAALSHGTTWEAVFTDARDDVKASVSREPDLPDPAELPEIEERIVHRDDMVPIGFLAAGDLAARSVCLLKVPRHNAGVPKVDALGDPELHRGTGWLAAAGLLITNHHVVRAREKEEGEPPKGDLDLQAAAATATFGYDAKTVAGHVVTVEKLEAHDSALDYAVLRLGGDPGCSPLRLNPEPVEHTPNRRVPVNIVQHPDGLEKKIALRNNLITATEGDEIRYFTDTVGGSSGSPVLDDTWRVVGLHRGAVRAKGVKFQGRSTAWVNYGTQIASVLAHLKQTQPAVHAELTAGAE